LEAQPRISKETVKIFQTITTPQIFYAQKKFLLLIVFLGAQFFPIAVNVSAKAKQSKAKQSKASSGNRERSDNREQVTQAETVFILMH